MKKRINRKIKALCGVIIAFSVAFAVTDVEGVCKRTDVTAVTAETFCAENTETTASGSGLGDVVSSVVGGIGSGGIGDIVGGIGSSGGIGDALGGIGDSLSGITGGLSGIFGGLTGGGTTVGTTSAPLTTTPSAGFIIPVPAATTVAPTENTESTVSTTEAHVTGETVNATASSNPYTKPTGTFKAGDTDETIKWLQWIFIYTDYGLAEDGITGVLDEATVEVVKKLQLENGLTADGNINEDVIKAAEILYYKTVLGGDADAVEVSLELTSGAIVSEPSAVQEKQSGEAFKILLIVVVVIIWMMAIGGIVIMFVLKKKSLASAKLNKVQNDEKSSENEAADNTDAENKESENKEDKGKVEIGSLSDLFEAADKNGK